MFHGQLLYAVCYIRYREVGIWPLVSWNNCRIAVLNCVVLCQYNKI